MESQPKRRSAVEYAEKVLGVHLPWDEALGRLLDHENATQAQAEIRNSIRTHKQRIEDRKFEVTTEAPSVEGYPDGVQARRDFVKVLLANDEQLGDLESTLDHLNSRLEHVSAEVKRHELALHVLVARMTELGGLLQFYAVAKQAEANPLVQVSPVSPHTPEGNLNNE
jgi:chromosome segregation ATPase